MRLRPLIAGAAGAALLVSLSEAAAAASADPISHTRTVRVGGHTCELKIYLQVSEGDPDNPERAFASTISAQPFDPSGDFDPYCVDGVEVVARLEYDSAGIHSNYVNRRIGPGSTDPYDNLINVNVDGESRYIVGTEADDGFHNGVASYKVFFPNGVQFTDTIPFPSSK